MAYQLISVYVDLSLALDCALEVEISRRTIKVDIFNTPGSDSPIYV